MVDQYNLRVSNQGIDPGEMRAVRIHLTGEGESELDGLRFDVIGVRSLLSSTSTHTYP